MKHYYVVSKAGDEISNNLLRECANCYYACSVSGKVVNPCPIYLDKRRQGVISNNRGTTFLCSSDTKTTKLFREKLEALSNAYFDLIIPKEDFLKEARVNEQQKVNRLIHNLTSINAHNIQEIYDLVPQELLTANYHDQIDHIQQEIRKNVKKAAVMFLRIAKHNIHMKSEFSIYKKLDRDDAVLEFRNHPIQKVIMNILHTFFTDFSDKGIYVDVENYSGRVKIDYESIQVALYHLIENANKYAMPRERILISFNDTVNEVEVHFKMKSLFVHEDEIERIYVEGYSGRAALANNLHGDGIGMWRIQQMMELNKGSIKFINGDNMIVSDHKTYSDNEIILYFKKK